MAASHETAFDGDDSEEWQDVDVSEEWGPITPSMATTSCCDVSGLHHESNDSENSWDCNGFQQIFPSVFIF